MTLQEEIKNGENRTLEYKVVLPEDSSKWIKTIVAFANGAGGKFIVGVNNKREFIGIPKEVDLFELKDGIADTIAQMCEPQVVFDITAEIIEKAQLLIIQVYPGNATPYYIKSQGQTDGTYIRLGATSRKADWTTLEELKNRSRHTFYDEQPFPNLSVTGEDKQYLCKDFSERAKREITKKELENLHLIIGSGKQTATNAYAILLGKHDYTSRIQCARFRGTERIDFMDKKEYEGPLCEQIDSAYKFVLNYLNMAIEINGIVHDEKYELPPQAIRELIINAAVHRNYQMSSSIQVAVYDDRVEISSPGSLYGTLTLEEALSGRSSIRNRTLARTFEKIGIVEGWGSGLKRIIGMCESCGVEPPQFIEIGDMLRVNFYRPSYKKIGDKPATTTQIGDKSAINASIGDKSAITEKEQIIAYLRLHPNAKSSEIASLLGLKTSRTKDYLSELVEEGTVIAHGANRNRTYSVK
jgi:ATP-dependent DNA helicase RecG